MRRREFAFEINELADQLGLGVDGDPVEAVVKNGFAEASFQATLNACTRNLPTPVDLPRGGAEPQGGGEAGDRR